MDTHLPTITGTNWQIAELLDSLRVKLQSDTRHLSLRLYFYAVSTGGWNLVRHEVNSWRRALDGREVTAYIGTDHGITEPDALSTMADDGIAVRLLTRYRGVYHPKLVWLSGGGRETVWVGSNNLSLNGLSHNVEFAIITESDTVPGPLQNWADEVEVASDEMSLELIRSYRTERERHAARIAEIGAFTWSKKQDPPPPPPAPPKPRPKTRAASPSPGQQVGTLSCIIPALQFATSRGSGDLVVQVMPRETGSGGEQLQLPLDAVTRFFGIGRNHGASGAISLTSRMTNDQRFLTITVYANNTARVSVSELDYNHRPCLIVFHKLGGTRYEFEIVQQSVSPTEYQYLLALCVQQTRAGARRWVIA